MAHESIIYVYMRRTYLD